MADQLLRTVAQQNNFIDAQQGSLDIQKAEIEALKKKADLAEKELIELRAAKSKG